VTADRTEREARCPDGGYCHGSTFAAGSEPCPEGTCFRVRSSGPLSGVFPGDWWPDEVRRANGVVAPSPQPTREEVERAEQYVRAGLADDLGDPTRPNGYTLAVIRARRDAREQALRPFRELFSGGPDTPCRTVYRFDDCPYDDRVECVEVPLDALRAAFTEAEGR
jgi:hypothetical protein